MKHSLIYFIVISFTGIQITGCSANNTGETASGTKDSIAAFDPSAMKKTIDEKNMEFAKAFVNGDSAGMVNHYTMDGKIFPPNSELVSGRTAISSLVSVYLKFGIKEFRDETTALYGTEGNLVEEGTFFMGDGKGNTLDKGKYLCVWRKEEGEWKIYSDIFNSSLPMIPAKK